MSCRHVWMDSSGGGDDDAVRQFDRADWHSWSDGSGIVGDIILSDAGCC